MKRRLIWSVVFTLFVAATGQVLLAQDADDNIARIYVVHVKSGQGMAFEAAFRAHMEWRKQQGDPWDWSVYQVVNGENLGDYFIRSGSHSWADLDAYEDFLVKAAPHLWASIGSVIESVDTYITATDQDTIRLPKDFSKVNYIAYSFYHLSMAEMFGFQDSIKKVHEAIGQSNWPAHYAWTETVNGGSGPTMTRVDFHENWASMQEPEKDFFQMLNEALGEEQAREVLAQITSAVRWVETSVGKRRSDLSLTRDQ